MRLLSSAETDPAPLSILARERAGKVNPQALRAYVEHLAEPRHFLAQPEANRRAAAWIVDLLREWGCDVEWQGGYGNVVALPKGVEGPLTLVCSHYDTVPATPGADDNGSAIAAMLECARLLQGTGAPVGYVCFNCEEDGLLGSIEFVRDWVPAHRGRLRDAHVLEMVGFASHVPHSQRVPPGLPIELPDCGDFLGLLANRDSGGMLPLSLARARAAVPDLPVLGLEVVDGMEQLLPVLLRSDHAPFWQARLPAMMWTDTSEFRNPHYHQPTDTPDTLDYDFLARVTRALIGAVVG
jgi:hypothetical protein